ncbi:TGF-beta receptor type-2-like isoform X2 [Dunckerocampus dactyliophorus]|uniref:TGF-beta receptor type-2-like isoform X2 n=1 Tax=Dunckerocampus dactyliophorus TaxID=161453 RepID=UPI0024058499|nr:TGF-beta receptor type-2-like isoform X2 [Dunckerocampus dactyliophorus]
MLKNISCSKTTVVSLSHLNFNLCKWCETSSPACQDGICLSNCSLSSYCASLEEICVSIWRKTNDTATVHTMCHNPALPLEGVEVGLLGNVTSRECHMVKQPVEVGASMVCACRGEHECNDKLIFADGFSRLYSKDVAPVVTTSLLLPLLLAAVATVAFCFHRTRHQGKHGCPAHLRWPSKTNVDHPGGGPLESSVQREESTAKVAPLHCDAGGPLPIKLEALLGKGRFAEVWRACLLPSDTVAVKVFPVAEYASWRNECAILSDPELKHDNVVGFRAAEVRGPVGHTLTTYWLVLTYHDLGNLQDFLVTNVLSWEELITMAASIARGLAHLHSDTTPTGSPKVPVAHRDVKSSNIVLKKNGECVLCDFGLALKLDLSLTVDDYANSGQVGTARYMAPEVLESRVNLDDVEAFKQMDVYSMALVLWEMASRCRTIGEVSSYEPAFGSKVCEHPCVDSMRDLVLRDRRRPDIPTAWTQHQGMNIFCSTMVECWDHDPEARLTAPCVLERFAALQQEEAETAGGSEGDKSGAKTSEDVSHVESVPPLTSSGTRVIP